MIFYLDITRLTSRIFRAGPTGIDRVEYAYARQMIDDPDVICVYTAPVFAGAIRAARAKDILYRVERAWRLDATAAEDAVYRGLRGWLDSPFDPGAAKPVRHSGPKRRPDWWSDI